MFKYWLFLALGVMISAVSQIFLKKAAQKEYNSFIRQYLNFFVILGYFMMAVSMFLNVLAYKGIDMKNGPVFEAFGFVLVFIFSRIFFGEKFTKRKIIGNSLIILGIIVFYLNF